MAPAPSLQTSPYAWRDDVLSAGDADAKTRSMREWLDEMAFADSMDWLTADQHREALSELDEHGRVFSAAEAKEIAEDDAYAAEQEIIHAMWTQGLSACPTLPTRRTGDNNMNGIAA